MGGAGTATADDYTAIFYNPANLTLREAIHLGAEYLTTVPSLSIDLADPPPGAPTPVEIDSFSGLGLGVVFPLGGKIDYRLSFGLVIYFPTQELLRIDALDPLIPRWYVWDSLADKLQILLGLGVRVTDWLSIGIGAQSLANIDGGVDVGVDPINDSFPSREMSIDIVNTVAPVVGVRLGPVQGFTLGLSWRAALEIEFLLPIALDFGEVLDVALVARGRALYTPHTLSFGLAWEAPSTPLTLTVDARYMLWSRAPDPALSLDLDIGGELVEALGLGDAIDFVPGPSAFPTLDDTLSLHMGGEYWFNDHVAARLGYAFRPTPVPEQPSVTNYVDNDAHTVSAGVGLSWPDPLNLDEYPVMIDVTGAYSILPTENTIKVSPDDPVGSYSAGGGILSISASLRHDF